MLVLTRKEGEEVWIGDTLVRVVKIRGGHIRLGIEAPESVNIVRAEIRDRDKESDHAADA